MCDLDDGIMPEAFGYKKGQSAPKLSIKQPFENIET